MKNLLSLSGGIFSGRTVSANFLFTLSFLLLFIISIIYLSLFGRSVFFYQENKSLFVFSVDYLHNFIIRPGGLLIYAGNFLTQFYHLPVLGSLIVSVLLLLLSFVFFKIIKHIEIRGSLAVLLVLLPSCTLLLFQTWQELYVFYIIGFLSVAIMFYVTIVTKRRLSGILIIASFPVFFYLAGAFAIIYLGMSVVYIFLTKKGKERVIILSIVAAAATLSFFVFREMIFFQPVDQLLLYPLFPNGYRAGFAILNILSGFFILFPLIVKIPASAKTVDKRVNVLSLYMLIAVIISSIFLLSRFYDPSFSGIMKLEKMVYERDWEGIIKQQERNPATDIISEYYFSLALSEKQQLCEKLFFVPRKYGPLSLTLTSDNLQMYRSLYYFYCIGLTSEAHHLAYELMVQHGYTPETIKMLVKTELIKGNYKIAARYLNILDKTIYYRKWTEKYHKMITNPTLVKSDPELSEKISLLPKNDFFILPDDSKTIDLFLKENPDNKRAFEYKIAQLLLGKDLIAVVNELKGMKAAGYNLIPRSIEEAIVQYVAVTQVLPDIGVLRVRPETANRFEKYRSVVSSFRGNKSLVETRMKKPDKNTFWYYLQFSVLNSDFQRGKPENYYLY